MKVLLNIIVGMLLLTSTLSAQEVYLDNVVIVLDASGSMNTNMRNTNVKKLQAAKTAITEVIKTIPQTTQVGLLVFGGQRHGWVQSLGPRNDASLFSNIQSITASGGTPLGEYMKLGADCLLATRKDQYGYGSYRLLIVTDGEANDPSLVDRYTPEIVARGIITDVIGVDMNQAHTLATKVQSYRRANDPAALTQAIREVFAEVGKTTDGQSGEEAFEALDGFPDALAMPIIDALATSGNHPIGDNPNSLTKTPDGTPSQAGTAQQTQHPKTASPKSTKKKNSNIGLYMFLFFAVVFIMGRKKNS